MWVEMLFIFYLLVRRSENFGIQSCQVSEHQSQLLPNSLPQSYSFGGTADVTTADKSTFQLLILVGQDGTEIRSFSLFELRKRQFFSITRDHVLNEVRVLKCDTKRPTCQAYPLLDFEIQSLHLANSNFLMASSILESAWNYIHFPNRWEHVESNGYTTCANLSNVPFAMNLDVELNRSNISSLELYITPVNIPQNGIINIIFSASYLGDSLKHHYHEIFTLFLTFARENWPYTPSTQPYPVVYCFNSSLHAEIPRLPQDFTYQVSSTELTNATGLTEERRVAHLGTYRIQVVRFDGKFGKRIYDYDHKKLYVVTSKKCEAMPMVSGYLEGPGIRNISDFPNGLQNFLLEDLQLSGKTLGGESLYYTRYIDGITIIWRIESSNRKFPIPKKITFISRASITVLDIYNISTDVSNQEFDLTQCPNLNFTSFCLVLPSLHYEGLSKKEIKIFYQKYLAKILEISVIRIVVMNILFKYDLLEFRFSITEEQDMEIIINTLRSKFPFEICRYIVCQEISTIYLGSSSLALKWLEDQKRSSVVPMVLIVFICLTLIFLVISFCVISLSTR